MTALEPGARADRGDPDPYPNYAWLRENAPVSELYVPHRGGTTWLVTSYDLARACLTDRRLSNDDRNALAGPSPFGSNEWDPARGLLDLDRPEHARLRGVVLGAFSAGAVERFRDVVRRVADEAVDGLLGRHQADLVSEFSLPVPVAIIHEVLGVPEHERETPARCLDLFFKAGLTDPIDTAALAELLAYVRHLVDYKRAHPGDDLFARLARGLATGELRDENELAAMVLSVLGAGHTTTVQFLGAAVVRLCQHPVQLAAVLAGELGWDDVVDEVLRYDSPVQASAYRHVTEDMELGGVHLTRGDSVLISLAAANRDPAKFPEPEEFRIGRTGQRHLAFGHGAHLCLGAQLARMEGEVALDVLFRRLDGLALSVPPAEIPWAYGPMLRGPRELPVTFSGVAAAFRGELETTHVEHPQ